MHTGKQTTTADRRCCGKFHVQMCQEYVRNEVDLVLWACEDEGIGTFYSFQALEKTETFLKLKPFCLKILFKRMALLYLLFKGLHYYIF